MPKLAVGDHIPSGCFQAFTSTDADEPVTLSTDDVFAGQKVVVFGLPGAFTSVCSSKQLPQFVERASALKEKGVTKIVCISVNDAWVMRAWGEKHNAGDSVVLLGDGDGSWTKAAGLEQELPGLGMRSLRYSLLVEDGVVKAAHIEDAGGKNYTVSGPETMLKSLDELKEK